MFYMLKNTYKLFVLLFKENYINVLISKAAEKLGNVLSDDTKNFSQVFKKIKSA